MSIVTTFYNDLITYWAKGAQDGFGGFTYATPITLYARWEDRTELATDGDGEEFVAKARVYVPQAMAMDDYIMLGESTDADPRTVDGAYRIRSYRRIPDLFGADEEKRVLL